MTLFLFGPKPIQKETKTKNHPKKWAGRENEIPTKRELENEKKIIQRNGRETKKGKHKTFQRNGKGERMRD